MVFILIFKSFLGALTPYGFTGYFDELSRLDSESRTYIIKGGPGCGKSSMMKRIGEKLEANGFDAEYIHCSSDPTSLDGVICDKLNFALADGTSPHVLEPTLPAARQSVISLYDCIDEVALSDCRDALTELTARNKRCFERAGRFVSAAASLYNDVQRASSGFLYEAKLERYIENLSSRLFPIKNETEYYEKNRFLSATTPDGIVSFIRENLATCTYRYILKDRFGAFAHKALTLLHEQAKQRGIPAVCCRCFLSPYDRLEALFLPTLSLCFVMSGFISPLNGDGCRVIHGSRFYDTEALRARANKLSFCKKTILSLLKQGCEILSEARAIHTEIEQFYIPNFDFEHLHMYEEALLAKYGLF